MRRTAATPQPGSRAAPRTRRQQPKRRPSVSFRRVVIDAVHPEVGAGRFAIKRTPGEPVEVTAVISTDGHDRLAAVLRFRRVGQTGWRDVPMEELGNDHWRAQFTATELGVYEYTVEAWIDRFTSWRDDLSKRWSAGQ